MFDRLAADGDRTSTGGEVFGYSDFYNEAGKAYARSENHATCGNCEGTWPIRGSAANWMAEDGEAMVKDGDMVLCPCRKNFVFASPDSNASYSNEPGAVQATAAPQQSIYDQQFTLRDANGAPIPDTYYTVRLPSGELIRGVTDAQGRTGRHTTESAEPIHFYLGHREEI